MDKKGFALIFALITLFCFVTLGIAFLVVLNAAQRVSSVQERSIKAFYLAEAGIEKTMAPILRDTDWSDNSNSDTYGLLGEGRFEVGTDYIGTNEQVKITSTGTVRGIDRTIELGISNVNAVGDSTAFKSAIFTAANLDYNGNPVVNGAIVAKGTISGQNSIKGDNTQTQNSPEPFPTLDQNYFRTLARANKANGNSGVNGNYFQGGNPSFSSLNGVIFIDQNPNSSPADIKLTSNTNTTDGKSAILIVIGSLTILGNVTFKGLIYTTGPDTCETGISGGSVNITGGIISKNNINLHGGTNCVITQANTSGWYLIAKISYWKEVYR